MSYFTPTVEDLWHAYWSHNSYERMIRGDHTPVTRAEFDHLIAKVRAEEREKADREPSAAEVRAGAFVIDEGAMDSPADYPLQAEAAMSVSREVMLAAQEVRREA